MAWTWAEGLSCWGLLYPTAVPSASTLLSHLTPGPKDWEKSCPAVHREGKLPPVLSGPSY